MATQCTVGIIERDEITTGTIEITIVGTDTVEAEVVIAAKTTEAETMTEVEIETGGRVVTSLKFVSTAQTAETSKWDDATDSI